MPIEIERKFLVRDETWWDIFTSKQENTDGLIAVANGRKVRVRVCDQRATLAVKSKTEGLANVEFEYGYPRLTPRSCSPIIAFVPGLLRPAILPPTVRSCGS